MSLAGGLLFYFVLGLTVTPLSLLLLLSIPFTSRADRYDMIRAWGRLMLAVLRRTCGISTRVLGMENCPASSAVVLSKHQSAWECFWLGCELPFRCAYVYKESLNRIPFFGWALWSVGLLGIDRSNGRGAFQTFATKGVSFLRQGWGVVIFPEGTRVAPGSHVKYKSGGARLAVMAGVPVVPVALNSGLVWPKNSIAKRPGVVTVSIGRPIETRGRSAREVNEEAEAWIEAESTRLLSAGRN